MIRNGIYTLFENNIFRIREQDGDYRLIYEGSNPPSGFIHYSDNVYTKNVPKSKITNAFHRKFMVRFKGYDFDIRSYYDGLVTLVTDQEKAKNNLNLTTYEPKVFQIEVSPQQIEKVWEIRSISTFGLPYPEGLQESKEIEIFDLIP